MLRPRACDVAVSAATARSDEPSALLCCLSCLWVCVSPPVSLSLCLSAHPTPPGWLCCAPRLFEVAVQTKRIAVGGGSSTLQAVWRGALQPCDVLQWPNLRGCPGCGRCGGEDAMRAAVVGGRETDQTGRELFLPSHKDRSRVNLAQIMYYRRYFAHFGVCTQNRQGCFGLPTAQAVSSSAPSAWRCVPRAARRLVTTEAP